MEQEISMSVSGISSSNFLNYNAQIVQTNMQQFRQEFQQLGQDLQSGNLSAAQTDLAALQQVGPQANSTSSTQSNNPIAQAFNQLSQDLRSGNLSAAQQDYATVRQDFQNQATQVHHHHHHGGSAVTQLLQQLGQDLQSGNVTAAQQAYNTLLQDFPQVSQSNGVSSTAQSSPSSSNSISMIA
jgi:outer membrane protein assembly factor BamD (BamD/ComL family)